MLLRQVIVVQFSHTQKHTGALNHVHTHANAHKHRLTPSRSFKLHRTVDQKLCIWNIHLIQYHFTQWMLSDELEAAKDYALYPVNMVVLKTNCATQTFTQLQWWIRCYEIWALYLIPILTFLPALLNFISKRSSST